VSLPMSHHKPTKSSQPAALLDRKARKPLSPSLIVDIKRTVMEVSTNHPEPSLGKAS
jgi:hypothetical protein